MVLAHGTVLSNAEIQIDGESYLLAREQSLSQLGLSARRWREERIPQATHIEPRPDVRAGPIKGEYVISWNDWSKGISGLHSPLVGGYNYLHNLDGTFPGSLRMISQLQIFNYATTPAGGDAVFIARHGGICWTFMGRLSLTLNNNALTLDKDFGSGVRITDGLIQNNSLYACFGDRALADKTLAINYKLWKRTTALSGTMWTQDDHTGAVTFTGSGLNDMTLHSTNNFFGDTTTNIRVEIDASAPTPDTFRWSADGGSSWVATGVACSTGAITLSPGAVDQGIRVVFAAVDGHTIGDRWDFTCTGVPHAHYLTTLPNKIWRAINYDSADTLTVAKVSNVDTTDDLEVLANWSAGLSVGDPYIGITDLNAIGDRLAVSKESGLYLGDENAEFRNYLPQIENSLHQNNGKNTVVRGSEIIFPFRSGIQKYGLLQSVEIGLEEALTDTDVAETPPSPRISASCIQGSYIWVATEPSLYPRAMPTTVYFYDAATANYTNYTTNVTDGSLSTTLNPGAFAILTGDYIYVNYATAAWYGIVMDLISMNANTGTISVAVSAGNDGNGDVNAWTTLPKSGEPMTAPFDGTTVITGADSRYFRQSGAIYWGDVASDWTSGKVNSVAGFWVRLSVSAASETAVPAIAEIRIVTAVPQSYILRGRPRTEYDRPGNPFVWESICTISGVIPSVTAMNLATYMTMPYRRGEALLLATRNRVVIHERPVTPTDQFSVEMSGGTAFLCKHDGGMPNANKQWPQIVVKGRTIDSTHAAVISYRMDETAAWTTAGTANSLVTTFTLSGVTGRSIQIRAVFSDVTTYTAGAPVTEINEIEAVFRPLWTYKRQVTAILEVADGQSTSAGGYLPDASVQLTNLEGDHGQGAVTIIDPLGRSLTCTIDDVSVVEHIQSDLGYPALLVQVVATEV